MIVTTEHIFYAVTWAILWTSFQTLPAWEEIYR